MQSEVPVNQLLSKTINKFEGNSTRFMDEHLSRYIDRLGEMSALAQGLSKVITTAEKLRNSENHILYLLKDASANKGKGELIGLLKVGRKHLYLFDENNEVQEVEPLCVLDFFVTPDQQRHGYGKLLFDNMLKDLEVSPHELAVDGPSTKMEAFLKTNYGIKRLIRQNNNFAISEDFFLTATVNESGRITSVEAPEHGRHAAPKPHSVIASIIHGDNGVHRVRKNGTPLPPATPEAQGDSTPVVQVNKQPNTRITNIKEHRLMESDNETKLDKEELADLQKSPERPSTLNVNPVSEGSAPAVSPAGWTPSRPPRAESPSPRRDSQLTDRGYFDIKFYHNKLW